MQVLNSSTGPMPTCRIWAFRYFQEWIASSLPHVFTARMNFLELGMLLTASELLSRKGRAAATALILCVGWAHKTSNNMNYMYLFKESG